MIPLWASAAYRLHLREVEWVIVAAIEEVSFSGSVSFAAFSIGFSLPSSLSFPGVPDRGDVSAEWLMVRSGL